MNLSLTDIKGSILSISQFTLYGNTSKGRRPSFEDSLNYNDANKLYEIFNKKLKDSGIIVEEGIFGANMKVELINDGPVTIIIDSKDRE
jgi:D-tyrosyl-tRNA(Tyr) deacylase